jgi:hypothetical protein
MEIYKTNPLRITSHSTVSISPVTHTSATPSPVFPPLGDWTVQGEASQQTIASPGGFCQGKCFSVKKFYILVCSKKVWSCGVRKIPEMG